MHILLGPNAALAEAQRTYPWHRSPSTTDTESRFLTEQDNPGSHANFISSSSTTISSSKAPRAVKYNVKEITVGSIAYVATLVCF